MIHQQNRYINNVFRFQKSNITYGNYNRDAFRLEKQKHYLSAIFHRVFNHHRMILTAYLPSQTITYRQNSQLSPMQPHKPLNH